MTKIWILLMVGLLAWGAGAVEFRRGIMLVPTGITEAEVQVVDDLLFDDFLYYDWAQSLTPEALTYPKLLVLLGDEDPQGVELVPAFAASGGVVLQVPRQRLGTLAQGEGRALLQQIRELAGSEGYWEGFSILDSRELTPVYEATRDSLREARVAMRTAERNNMALPEDLSGHYAQAQLALEAAKDFLEVEPIRVMHYILYTREAIGRIQRETTPTTGAWARGIWMDVDSLVRLNSPQAVEEAVETIALAGFNMVFPQVVSVAGSVFPSAYSDPRFETLSFDLLQVLIQEAQARGLAVHAWMETLSAGTQARPGLILQANPDWADLDLDGGRVSDLNQSIALSPMAPGLQEVLNGLVVGILKYPFDGLHLEGMVYNQSMEKEFGYWPGSVEAFTGATALDPRSSRRSQDWREWSLFREEQLTQVLTGIAQEARAHRPQILLSATGLAHPHQARYFAFQNWEGWLAQGILDFVVVGANSEEAMVKAMAQTGSLVYPRIQVGADIKQALTLVEAARANSAYGVSISNMSQVRPGLWEELAGGPFRIPALLPHRQPGDAVAMWLSEAAQVFSGVPAAEDLGQELKDLAAEVPALLQAAGDLVVLERVQSLYNQIHEQWRTRRISGGLVEPFNQPLGAAMGLLGALTPSEVGPFPDGPFIRPEIMAMRGTHWTKRVEVFLGEDPPGGAWLFVGDSITEGFPLQQYFPGRKVINRGIGGDSSLGIWDRRELMALEMEPTMVFLKIGINNLVANFRPDQIAADVERFLTYVQQEAPKARIVLISICPVTTPFVLTPQTIMRTNAQLQEVASRLGVEYLDLFSRLADSRGQLQSQFTGDGIHFTPTAYRVWAQAIEELVAQK